MLQLSNDTINKFQGKEKHIKLKVNHGYRSQTKYEYTMLEYLLVKHGEHGACFLLLLFFAHTVCSLLGKQSDS